MDKRTIRNVLRPTTDALTVVLACAMVDPENWADRAEHMLNGTLKSLHGEWVLFAERKLRSLLDQ